MFTVVYEVILSSSLAGRVDYPQPQFIVFLCGLIKSHDYRLFHVQCTDFSGIMA
jgi:hypothetical protein